MVSIPSLVPSSPRRVPAGTMMAPPTPPAAEPRPCRFLRRFLFAARRPRFGVRGSLAAVLLLLVPASAGPAHAQSITGLNVSSATATSQARNLPPEVELEVTPRTVQPRGEVTLTASASDRDGDELSLRWTSSGEDWWGGAVGGRGGRRERSGRRRRGRREWLMRYV